MVSLKKIISARLTLQKINSCYRLFHVWSYVKYLMITKRVFPEVYFYSLKQLWNLLEGKNMLH